MQKALIHRYDNKADILGVEKHCCSEVYRRSKDDTLDVVIVAVEQSVFPARVKTAELPSLG
jgi:hypothetical protein